MTKSVNRSENTVETVGQKSTLLPERYVHTTQYELKSLWRMVYSSYEETDF